MFKFHRSNKKLFLLNSALVLNCWIFEIGHFHHRTFVCVRLCLLIPNFVLIGQYGAESFQFCYISISPKMIFNMASVRHLEFGNFWIFVTFPLPCSIFASAYQISSNSDDSWLRYGAITIFKMAAIRHVGFSKFDISSSYLRTRAIMPPHSKFRLNRTYGTEL